MDAAYAAGGAALALEKQIHDLEELIKKKAEDECYDPAEDNKKLAELKAALKDARAKQADAWQAVDDAIAVLDPLEDALDAAEAEFHAAAQNMWELMGGHGAVPTSGPISDADLLRLARLDAVAFGNGKSEWIAHAESLLENGRFKTVPELAQQDPRAEGEYDPESGELRFKTSFMDKMADKFNNGDWLGEAKVVGVVLHEVRHAEQGPLEFREHPADPGRGGVPQGSSEWQRVDRNAARSIVDTANALRGWAR